MANKIHGETQKTSSLTSKKRKLFIRQFGQQNLGQQKANTIPRKNGRVSAPLSLTQQRMWLQTQIEPDCSINNVINMLHLCGDLNQAALESALNKITARHEVLRTTFTELDGEAMQHIAHHSEFRLITINLRNISPDQRQEEVKSIAQSEAQHFFDLSRDTLIRVVLLQLDQQEHVLIITLHHIVSDGWSTGVLYREMETFYRSSLRNEPAILLDLPIQYADFAEWQRNWLQGDAVAPIVDFWKKELLNAPRLKLPFDRCYTKQPDHLTEMRSLQLSAELTGKIKQLGQNENCTLFMTLLACFNVLLHRYSGETDIVIGTPISGRHGLDEIKDLIGFFVNTMALRTDLSGDPSFRQQLGRVREMALRAYRHSTLPFDKLVEILRPDRLSHRNPLFDVMINIHESSWHEFRLDGLNIEEWKLAEPLSDVALSLDLMLDNGCLLLTLKYQPALFDEWRINLMLGHLKTLLEGCVANPDQSIAMLPLLTDAERRQLLVEWNDTTQDYPRDLCVHQLFEAQVERTPDTVAVVHQGQQLSYAELNERANQLARHLTVLGVGPEVLVGLCLERSLKLMIGVLGILKAGGIYVPLDPGLPQARLAFMLEDTCAPVLLTQQCLLRQFPSFDGAIVCLDRDWKTIETQPVSNLPCGATAESLAYIIYTSGSTGVPKGVMMPHRPICNLTWWQMRTSAMDRGACTLQMAPAAFDVSVQEIFSTLCAGGTLALIADHVRHDPTELLDIIENASVVRLFLTFTALQQLAETAVALQRALRNLREVITAGEQLRITPSIARWFDTIPECRLYNQYGPTETHVVVTHSALEGLPQSWPALPPIGRPIPNARIYVLDGNLRPLPVGTIGEIVIGGDCLARGYLNRQELTAERFVADPFCGEAGARMYRSGDFGSFRDDGTIEFQGRRDHQVKVRGFRIEIGEVEAAIDQHPDVVRAAVTVYEPNPGDHRLVAYVESRTNLALNSEVLRAFLLEKLPEYMVPLMFVQLATLPISPTGKIDRKALPPPSLARPQIAAEYIEAAAPQEQRLLEIWQDLLGFGEIGIDDNFFALGGDSLTATRLISRVRKAFECDVSYRDLFSNPTIRGLGNLLARTSSAPIAATSDAAMLDGRLEPEPTSAPATPEQEAIWLAASLQPGLPVYNECFAVHFNARIGPEALQSALNGIIARHDILRTGFNVENGQVVQKIAPETDLTLITVDFTHVPAAEAWKMAVTAVELAASECFDLKRAPLMRGVFARMPDTADVLFLTMHHLIIDAFGFYYVLMPELAALYEKSVGKVVATQLRALPIQFSDYARLHQQVFRANSDQLRAFWKTQLADLTPLELPADRTRPLVRSFCGEFLTLSVERPVISALRELAIVEGTTFFTILVAAFKVLLFRYTGQQDIGIGTVDAGRASPEHERLLGCCASTLVLRTALDADLSFRELLRIVRDTTTTALEHKDFPLREMVELLPQHDAMQRPPLPVAFVLEPRMPASAKGWSVSQHDIQTGTAKFDLMFEVEERESALIGRVEYAADLFDRERIERMVEHWRVLLGGFVADPEQRIGQLPLLTATERHQLLVEWNDIAVDYPREQCINLLFEQQAAETPHAVAVVCDGAACTYAELNARANQLAHYLRSKGVEPGVLVGLCLERSLEHVLGMLSILKAGGAYLPLDPGSPQDRLRLMLDDTHAPVILTKSGIKDRLPSGEERVLSLDTQAHQWQDCADTNPPQLATAADMAYVMYTSGSTGTPKGVMVTHRGIARLVCNNNYIHLDSTDAVAHVSNPAFDAATFEIWGALVNGSRLIIIPGDIVLDPSRLADVLRHDGISTLFLTTALFNEVVRARPSAFVGLKQILFGGEAADPHRVRECLHAGGPQRLLHVYGPTETTTFATWYPVTTVAPGQSTIPIGRPIANTTAYVMDRHLQLVPVGVAGELYIGGDGLARGYWQRPELTAGHFVAHPFVAGEKLYKTGDLVRYLPDGNLEFLGRLDTQVKLRGFRIELGEIESLLTQQPQVRAAVVLLREDMPEDKRLVAYVVAQAEPVNINELRAALKYHLPDYMIPADFVALPTLPLNPNGKIDRKALPAPVRGAETALSSLPRNAPSNPVEEAVAGVWYELLHLQQIGIHDNFFALGGHSLLAIQMLSRLRDLFVIELSLRTVFDAPTIAELAGQISTALTVKNESLTLPIRAQPSTTQLPLSFAQQRLWFQERLAPEGAAYNIALAVRLEGELNTNALVTALNMTVARHDALRTTFGEYGDEPMQVIAPSLNLMLAFEDLSAFPAVQLDAELQQRAQDAAQTRFDLERGPLLRATLLHLGERSQVLVLVMHHIVSDGWSIEVLLRELSVSYGALVRGELPSLPALPMQYADYALWQREILKGETLGQQLEYWTRQLADTPFLRLPTDRVPPAVQCLDGSHKHLRLSVTLIDELKRLSAREGVTLFMTLLAALQVLLARHTGQMDIPVGTPIAGRTRRETEGLIGFFVNTLVLRTDVSGNPSFLGLLLRVREVCLEAYANPDLSFEKLVEVLKPTRDLSHHPLFDVMLNLLEGQENVLQLDGLKSQRIELDTAYAKFAITLYVEVQTSGINLDLVYQNALFSAEHMAQLLEQYHYLLEQIVEAPECGILSYSLITPSLRARLPNPRVVIDAPKQVPVTRQFALWVERQPEAIAISQGTQQWSYRSLADAAHRLAQSLADSGIGQGDVVAITGPSSFGLVSSMLGVWLSGGVFLTIDSLLPQARQHVMMREAGIRAICRIGASSLPEGSSGLDAAVAVFEIDPARGIVGFASANTRISTVPLHDPDGDAPAYIFFTSGSTGIPKGILGCHKGLSHFLGWQRETFEIGPHDRVAQLTSLSFDVLLRDIFLPLTSGSTLCIPENNDKSEPLAWLERERVTVMHTVPTLLQSWLAQPSARVGLHALRWLFVAGEPLTATLVLAWRETFPGGAEVVNLYGTTEATLVKCFYRITNEIEPGVQPIGAALPQTQALVLNEAGTPCGAGEAGQVVLRTPFRSLGYINAMPEMRTCFVRNPYRDDADDLLYFTGDRGRYRVDGTLDFLGRLDDQVKIRGVRVEPAEVTAVLGMNPAVKACVVVGRSNEHGESFLLAYVAIAPSNQISASELRSYLNTRLPAALVPTEWLFLDDLPRLPNGKVNRSVLPVPAMPQIKREIAYVAPSTPAESKLVEIWQGLLDVVRIGVNDNFFDMGGHSLKLMQLASRIRRVFNIDLPLIRLFDMPTVAELACELARIAQQFEDTELERMLSEIELLSDEETVHELNARSADT